MMCGLGAGDGPTVWTFVCMTVTGTSITRWPGIPYSGATGGRAVSAAGRP